MQHRTVSCNDSRVLHEISQACLPGYTVQGMYCAECDGTADPAVKMVAARFVTVFIVLVFGSWCVRPYFAKTEAKIRRMASEQGARLGSRISKQLGTFREKVAIDVQMQVRSTQHVTASCPCQAVSLTVRVHPHCCVCIVSYAEMKGISTPAACCIDVSSQACYCRLNLF